ncbi:MAG: putative RND superfamily exporter protein [Roseivirga sp.]|jgi:predicted RND superfamily exporter protein
MFTFIARLILRNRIAMLSIILGLSFFMAYEGQFVKFSFKFSRLLPKNDTVQVDYDDFRERFNQVGNTVVLAIDSFDVFADGNYQLWHQLETKLLRIDGVEKVLSPTNALNLTRNDSAQTLFYSSITPALQAGKFDSIRDLYNSLPFYKGLLQSENGQVPLMLVRLDPDQIYNKNIVRIVEEVIEAVVAQEALIKRDIKISGLPHIRMANTNTISGEIFMLVGLALLVTGLILYAFLRSFRAMLISMVVVILGVFWSFGLISFFDYQISMLSSLIPSLVIVIGVPNCIFLINKYHTEYKNHGNRVLALQRVIRKIGAATLMTNITTAMGFAALILTDSVTLREFGVVASINVMMVFIISIVLIPIYFSFAKAPKERHYNHLEQRWVKGFIDWLIHTTMYHRKWVYVSLTLLLAIALFGVSKIYTTGNLSEEFKKSDPVYKDLHFLEKEFTGVVPLELVIDTRQANGIYKASNLKRIDRLQDDLSQIKGISRSLSIVDGLKFAKQAYYRGDSSFYALPTRQERSFIASFLPKGNSNDSRNLISSLADSTGRYTRVTMQVKDMGKEESVYLQEAVDASLAKNFPKEKYDVTVTGAWVVFQKGTTYLIKNLAVSLSLAILVIALVMAFIFRSLAMVLVSLIPNIFPLIMTAGIMGYFGIPLKPSTVLVFSVAFGISIDDTIHFLAKYRQELKNTRYNIGQSVLLAIRETGVSMFYTSIVLFFGFIVFTASSFGGIVALGILVSITLVIAMIGNLLILPTLLLSFEKLIISKSFTEPYITIYDEEVDENEDFEGSNP